MGRAKRNCYPFLPATIGAVGLRPRRRRPRNPIQIRGVSLDLTASAKSPEVRDKTQVKIRGGATRAREEEEEAAAAALGKATTEIWT